MISIAGLGISGGYLLRRLRQDGFEAEGYDPKSEGFYIPCGYATNRTKLGTLLKNVGITIDSYVESEAGEITLSTEDGREIHLPSGGLCTIDKNRLEADMLQDISFIRTKAGIPQRREDPFIDATGVSRYYLGPASNDFLMYTKEYLTEESSHADFYFRYFSKGKGYYWEFPLNGKFHVGAGGDNQYLVSNSVDWVKDRKRVASRKIRLSPLFDDMFNGNVIGVGEAIGTVSPITGEGILPSMESAEILYNCFKRYSDVETLKVKYREEIMRTFKRYPKLFQLLKNTRNGELRKAGNMTAIWSAKEDFENFGIDLRISKVLRQLALR